MFRPASPSRAGTRVRAPRAATATVRPAARPSLPRKVIPGGVQAEQRDDHRAGRDDDGVAAGGQRAPGRVGRVGAVHDQLAVPGGGAVLQLRRQGAAVLELLTTRVSDRIGSVAEILEADPGSGDALGDLSRLLVTVADRNAEFVALAVSTGRSSVR